MTDNRETQAGLGLIYWNGVSIVAGRPTKYKSEYAKIAKKMCELGATDFDIVEALGIARSTFYKWRNDHKPFSDALKVGKTVSDDRVEMSLYRKAVGFEYEAVKIFQFQGEEVIVPYTEVVAPDTTAAIFWLKNRKPDQYRANPDGDNGDEAQPLNITINTVDASKHRE